MYRSWKQATLATLAVAAGLFGARPLRATEVTRIAGPLISEAWGIDHRFGATSAYFAEAGENPGEGRLWSIDMTTLAPTPIGTGYTYPTSVGLAADARHLYVSEWGLGGSLLRVDLRRPNRATATVVASGFEAAPTARMTQIALDESHGYAYIAKLDWPDNGIWRVELGTGTKSLLLPSPPLSFPTGLLVDRDARFAYVCEREPGGSSVKRLNLATGSAETLVTSSSDLWQLGWADPDQTAIDVASMAGILSLDLARTPLELAPIATLGAYSPYSLARVAVDRLLVTAAQDGVFEVRLSDFDPSSSQVLLGIGFVPVDRISPGGYADTTVDPDATFRVKDSPFGGVLSVMLNHGAAFDRPNRARWYQVLVDGVPQEQSWSDYRWDSTLRRFILQTVTPAEGGYYEVRDPRDLWYTPWLGCRLATSHLTNGLHALSIKLFTSRDPRHEVGSGGDAGRHANLMIDNLRPAARIETIRHEGTPVDSCAIVHGPCTSDHFTFCLTASDADQHLMGWRLTALWGDGQSRTVAQDSYTSPGPLWSGRTCDPAAPPPDPDVPSPPWEAYIPGDPSAARCGYTFALSVSDRAIDGYRYIHTESHHKSLAIELSGCP